MSKTIAAAAQSRSRLMAERVYQGKQEEYGVSSDLGCHELGGLPWADDGVPPPYHLRKDHIPLYTHICRVQISYIREANTPHWNFWLRFVVTTEWQPQPDTATNAWVTASAVMSTNERASGHLWYRSTYVRKYVNPCEDGRRPTISMYMVQANVWSLKAQKRC